MTRSFSAFRRIPDLPLLLPDPGTVTDHVQATRADVGSDALIYAASGLPFTLTVDRLAGPSLAGRWHGAAAPPTASTSRWPKNSRGRRPRSC